VSQVVWGTYAKTAFTSGKELRKTVDKNMCRMLEVVEEYGKKGNSKYELVRK
jgi:hypothetical protein